MRYHDIKPVDMLNGDGLRVSLWVSGCSFRCKNCQNPETWDFNSGLEFDSKAKIELFKALCPPYIQGITLTGGHPLEECNLTEVCELLKEIKKVFPHKDVWIYTGYTYEHLERSKDERIKEILKLTDVIVDGAYEDNLKDVELKWRGSKNQRVIDVQASKYFNTPLIFCV